MSRIIFYFTLIAIVLIVLSILILDPTKSKDSVESQHQSEFVDNIQLRGADGRNYWLWIDHEGNLRIGDKPTFESITGGTKVGVQ